MFMERAELLPKIQYISIVMDCACLDATSATYNIPLQCYMQIKTHIRKSTLQTTFQQEADLQPVFDGLSSCKDFQADESIEPP